MDRLEFTNRRFYRRRDIESYQIDNLYDFLYNVEDLQNVVTPIKIIYRDVEIYILEVSKIEYHDHVEYILTVQLKYHDKLTHPFPLYCKDVQDFVRQIREDIIRMKIMYKFLRDTLDMLTF